MVQPAHVLRRFKVSARKLQGPLQRDKWAGYCGVFFLSYRTPKIPSSLNKPVPGSNGAIKSAKVANHD